MAPTYLRVGNEGREVEGHCGEGDHDDRLLGGGGGLGDQGLLGRGVGDVAGVVALGRPAEVRADGEDAGVGGGAHRNGGGDAGLVLAEHLRDAQVGGHILAVPAPQCHE
jgi:hypothetical protein